MENDMTIEDDISTLRMDDDEDDLLGEDIDDELSVMIEPSATDERTVYKDSTEEDGKGAVAKDTNTVAGDEVESATEAETELSVEVEGLETLVKEPPQQQQDNNNNQRDDASFVSCMNNRTVQVAVRVRPLLGNEKKPCLEALYERKNLTSHARDRSRRKHHSILRVGDEEGPTYCYDEVFPENSSQEDIYEHRVAPLVDRCLAGYNATIVAYGQTGSGKTYTMTGPPVGDNEIKESEVGVIPRALRDLFEGLEARSDQSVAGYSCLVKHTSHVRVQFLELYMDDIRDLLRDPDDKKPARKVTLRCIGEKEPDVIGSCKPTVTTADEALELLKKGLQRRATGATSMNATSSRSHAIFSVMVEQQTTMTGAVSKGSHVKRSRFHLCDLAGSERQKRIFSDVSDAQQRLRKGEVCQINMGLLALGNVISALGDPKRASSNGYVPYRDSKLTLLLKGSLGGNHHTLMIACVSPAVENKEETTNALRYANRAKNITNHVVVNLDRRSQLLNQLQSQFQSLANDLLVAYEQDTTGGVDFRNLLETIAAGEQSGKVGPSETKTKPPKPITPPVPSLSASADGSPRPSRHVSMIPRLRSAMKQPEPVKIAQAEPVKNDITDEEIPGRLAGYEKEIKALRGELQVAKHELVVALASDRNPPDDGSISDLSESSFPSRIGSVKRFDSQDSVEVRGLRRRLCRRLETLQGGKDSDQQYSNEMKQYYEKVKNMSAALQQKEDAKAVLMQRWQECNVENKGDQRISSTRQIGLPRICASAVVYMSVVYCVASTIYSAC
ncbi:Kinesin-like protein [Seminavis robusta]|uniref:Kinesin-like protein n=1 Tax=Seminavis robusta TaxID=568900 RepID=A0A9N8HSV1_9STRA|nr:Kinesin-like protein [Seminavis robusta]|eukprot:Sro1570_g283230.1 Kinesin-like protein (786) ;mRNA; f:11554-14108